jgi:hypothetical protein
MLAERANESGARCAPAWRAPKRSKTFKRLIEIPDHSNPLFIGPTLFGRLSRDSKRFGTSKTILQNEAGTG